MESAYNTMALTRLQGHNFARRSGHSAGESRAMDQVQAAWLSPSALCLCVCREDH